MSFASLMLVLALGGCGGPNLSRRTYRPSVGDTAHLLRTRTKARLRSEAYPAGYAVAIRTAGTVRANKLVAAADDEFDAIAAHRHDHDAFSKRGVLVFLTAHPRLIQLRVGSELYVPAQRASLTWGPAYIAHQYVSGDRYGRALLRTVRWVTTTLHGLRGSWQQRAANKLIYHSLAGEIEDVSKPSDGFYGNYLFKPVLHVRLLEVHLLHSYVATFILIGALLLLVRLAAGAAVVRLMRKLASPWTRGAWSLASLLFQLALALVLVAPGIASALYLSGSRREDQIAIQHSDLPHVGDLVFHPGLWNHQTGLIVAAGLGLLRIASGVADRAWLVRFARLPAERQAAAYERAQEHDPVTAFLLMMLGTRTRGGEEIITTEQFEREPYTNALLVPLLGDAWAGLRWALCAWLLLPLTVAIAALTVWAPRVLIGAVTAVRGVLTAAE